jgi:ATP-binding cassette, subfamily B, bacterial
MQKTNSLFKFIRCFLKPYLLWVVFFLSVAVLSGLMLPMESYYYKRLINLLSQSNYNVKNIIISAILILLAMKLHTTCWRIFNIIKIKTAPLLKNNIISYAFTYVHQQDFNFFQDNFSGTISKNITALADKIETLLYDCSAQIIRGITQTLVALVIMYFVHPAFTFILFTWVILFTLCSSLCIKKITVLSDGYAQSQSAVTGAIVDSVVNFANVKIFGAEKYEAWYLQKSLNTLKTKFIKKDCFLTKMFIAQGFAWIILFGSMLFMLIHLKLKEQITIGDFVLIFSLSSYVAENIWWLMETLGQIYDAIGTSKQSLRALFTPIGVSDKPKAKRLTVSKGEITFDKIHFNYHGSSQLFRDKSITIEPGSKVGLVGYSGSGKTTFVHLILRLYDIIDGSIKIDGKDIREITQQSLHESIGMIPQDPSLFHRTLLENIRYGKPDASDKEVMAASKAAHAHEFIQKLPLQYDALVGERGIKLSGGQRQRIAIARVILKNAPILILDEATSALDSVIEQDIQDSLLELMDNKTTIVIAHRLSTLLQMDRILVFDNGVIAEEGSHRSLLKKNGLYKTLWDTQVGGFLPD